MIVNLGIKPAARLKNLEALICIVRVEFGVNHMDGSLIDLEGEAVQKPLLIDFRCVQKVLLYLPANLALDLRLLEGLLDL